MIACAATDFRLRVARPTAREGNRRASLLTSDEWLRVALDSRRARGAPRGVGDQPLPLASMSSLAIVLLLSAAVLPHPAAAAIHGVFAHGVASGDPTHESVIIWTRVTPTGRDQPGQWDPADAENSTKTFRVTWTVSTEPPESRRAPGVDIADTASSSSSSSSRATGSHPRVGPDAEIWSWDPARVVASGVVITTGATDWTVKVDVRGLHPNVQHYYAFNVTGDRHSPAGAFRLPPPPGEPYPPDAEPVRIAVFSCANWAWGHFHAYDAAARGWGGAAARLDAWVHLGDYYEYSDAAYPAADEAVPDRWASLDPRSETVTLAEYRARHALHRTDPGLMALSASAPLVAMWDDPRCAITSGSGRRRGSSDGSRGEIRRSRASGDSRVPRVVTHARTHGE